ncbi:hypothetical protein BJX99DRAFT_258140 [Aspergillus californicus]
MPMIWNDQADAKLLMAIIAKSDAKLNWTAIAEYMGPDCTISALQHRVQRLKDRAKTGTATTKGNGIGTGTTDDAGAGSPVSSNPSPEKRKRGRSKRNPTATAPGDGDMNSASGNEDGGSPAKKGRGRKSKIFPVESEDNKLAAAQIKSEHESAIAVVVPRVAEAFAGADFDANLQE